MQLNEFKLLALAKPASKVDKSPFVVTDNFRLPFNVCIHHLSDTPNQIGIRGSNPLLRRWSENGSTGVHVVDTLKPIHRARFRPVSKAAISSYFQKQSVFTKVNNIDRATSRERQLIVMDYSALKSGLTLSTGIYQFYHEYDNLVTAILDTLTSKTTTRLNILQLRMPDVLVDKAVFNTIEEEFGNSDAQRWLDYDSLWLRELWLLTQDKGKLKEVVKATQIYACIPIANTLLTIDLNKLHADGIENSLEARNALYRLLDKAKSMLTPTDTDGLNDVVEASDAEIREASQGINELTNIAVASGAMSASEQKRFIKLAELSKDIPSVDGTPIGEFSKTRPEDYNIGQTIKTNIPDEVANDSDIGSTIDNFNRSYVKNVLDKHIAATALAFNDSGYILRDFSVDEHVDAINHNRVIKLKLMPISGKETTFEFPVPVINPDNGQYKADGVSYSTDIQRVDSPIRKTAPNKVACTSYYGKVFFGRSELAKYDWGSWLKKSIFAISLDSSDKRITKLLRAKNLEPDATVPRSYFTLCTTVESFTSNGVAFNFNYFKREETFGKEAMKYESKGFIAVGRRKDDIVYMDKANALYTMANDKPVLLAKFKDQLGITTKEPNDMLYVKVYGKSLPMAFMLGSYIGFTKLVKLLGATIRTFPANTRDRLDSDSWIELLFSDKRVYISKQDSAAAMLLSGYTAIGDQLRSYKLSDLDETRTYTPLIMDMGYSPAIAKELDLMKRYFLDPITIDKLKAMDEPTKWIPLLERVIELLTTDDYPDETHPGHQQLRGYERIPGMLYSEMVSAIRKHEAATNTGSRKLEISKFVLWKGLTEDSSTQLVQNANPLHVLKQQEAITLTGAGGRSARTLVMRSRIYHDKDVGIISEATPDSAKVATRVSATPKAKIKSLLGDMGEYDSKADSASSLLSTTSLFLPASHHDD